MVVSEVDTSLQVLSKVTDGPGRDRYEAQWEEQYHHGVLAMDEACSLQNISTWGQQSTNAEPNHDII